MRSAAGLWTYSVWLYQQPGVAAECLSLQERFGVNVNLLLLAAFAGSSAAALWTSTDVADAERAIGEWHAQVVRPLQELRRLLKSSPAPIVALAPEAMTVLQGRLQDAELESERVESAILTRWCEAHCRDWRCGERHAVIAQNVDRVISHYACEAAARPRRLIAAALAACCDIEVPLAPPASAHGPRA